MNKVCVALLSSLLTFLYSSAFTPTAEAQQRRRTQAPGNYGSALPRAQFQSLMRTPGTIDNDLPVVDGLHLKEGLSRGNQQGGPVQPYQPGEPKLNGALVRWDTRRMPLKIWISEGKKLPEVPFEILQEERVPRIQAMLRDPRSFDALSEAPGWKPEMNESVANGFEIWRDKELEGLFSFGFVATPQEADVMVFFTDHFTGAAGPGGTDVHALTMGQVFTPQQVQMKLERGEPTVPVVMELVVNEDYGKMQADAAHEFGHALGIKAHSPYREDLMYVHRAVTHLSAADKATIRALYKAQPKYWYY
jgi:predicted Zn-dependent protease